MKKFFNFLLFCNLFLAFNLAQAHNLEDLKQQIEKEIAVKKHVEKVTVKFLGSTKFLHDDDYKLENIELKFPSSFTATVTINKTHSYSLQGSFYEYLLAPVARTKLFKGQIIDNASINDKFILKKLVNKNTLLHKANITGKIATQNLQQGGLFTAKNTKRNLLISRGDVVTLKIQRNSIEIDSKAIALSSGGIGDNIKVKVHGSGKIVIAKVSNASTVQIQKP